jgi:glycosyltransferase involved in cell wall biosynthesis
MTPATIEDPVASVSLTEATAPDHAGGAMVDSNEVMREAVVALLRNPERRKALGREGAVQIPSAHGWDKIPRKHEGLYQSITRELPRP